MDPIINFLLSEPRRMTSLGRTLIMLAATIVMMGMIGHVATSIPNALSLLQKAPAPQADRTLAELYPDLWTWWVPETLFGCLPAIIMAAIGFRLWTYGRKVIRLYH